MDINNQIIYLFHSFIYFFTLFYLSSNLSHVHEFDEKSKPNVDCQNIRQFTNIINKKQNRRQQAFQKSSGVHKMNNTYSLRAILQSDLDPALCKLMLHEIKSPLLEHSFQLTTDDQHNLDNTYNNDISQHKFYDTNTYRSMNSQYGNQNRNAGHTRDQCKNREKMEKERDREFEKMHQRLNDISMVVSEQQPTKRQNRETTKIENHKTHKQMNNSNRKMNSNTKMNNNINKSRTVQPKQQQRQESAPFILGTMQQQQQGRRYEDNRIKGVKNVNSIVSPFQYGGNIIVGQDGNLLEDFSCSTQGPVAEENNQIARWCGQVFATDYKQSENELVVDYKPYNRKPIFARKQPDPRNSVNPKQSSQPLLSTQLISTPRQSTNPYSPKFLTFPQSIQKLSLINQPQLTNFLIFVSKLLKLFDKIVPLKQKIQKNQALLIQYIISNNPVDHQFRETISNKNRILWRFGVRKVSQVFQKICERDGMEGKQKVAGEVDNRMGKSREYQVLESQFSQIMQLYSEIEDIIQDYTGKKDIIAQLNTIYNLLHDTNIPKNNHPYPQSPPNPSQHLLSTMQFLLARLQINPQQYRNISQLQYIWKDCLSPLAYVPLSQIDYKKKREKFINQLCKNDILVHEAVRNIDEVGVYQKLVDLGYRRNVG